MSIGEIVRKLLGKKLFPVVGRFYRSIFIDLDKVAQLMSQKIPRNAHILDIGGGHGILLNYLMDIRKDISITMFDVKANIGNSIFEEFKNRVDILPETSIDKYLEMNKKKPDCIIISDVIHHLPSPDRIEFFNSLNRLIKSSQALLLIKDIEPGHFKSTLGYLADRYISGDKNVSPISKAEIISLSKNIFGKVTILETELYTENSPNYLLSIEIG